MAWNGKLTSNQEAFNKELKRIEQFIKRAEKRGFKFDRSVIPDRPQRVTKERLAKMKDLTPDSLYKRATYTDPATGQKIPGTEGRTLERRRAGKKAWETRRINKIREELKSGDPRGPGMDRPPITSRWTELGRELEAIEEIHFSRGRQYSIAGEKSQLLLAYENTTERFREENNIEYLERYMLDIESDLSQCLWIVHNDSDEDNVRSAITKLITLINMGSLSLSQLQSIEDQQDTLITGTPSTQDDTSGRFQISVNGEWIDTNGQYPDEDPISGLPF